MTYVELYKKFYENRRTLPPTEWQIEIFRTYVKEHGVIKLTGLRLGISDKTVEYHLQAMRRKLKLQTFVDLVIWGFRNKVIR